MQETTEMTFLLLGKQKMKTKQTDMLHTGSLFYGNMDILDRVIDKLFSAAVFGEYETSTLTHLVNTLALKVGG